MKFVLPRITTVFVLLSITFPFSSAVAGSSENSPRHSSMKTLGKNMKTISRGVKSGNLTPDLKLRASEIQEISTKLVSLFPKGHEHEGSRAKAEIWSDATGFKKANQNFIRATNILLSALESGDIAASQAALKATGKTCGGCHKGYRLPKK
jgi:cytochrome c556